MPPAQHAWNVRPPCRPLQRTTSRPCRPNRPLDRQVGGAQPVDARLLAAVRALAAKYQSEVEGRSLQQLGDWDKPLNRQNEVRRHARTARMRAHTHAHIYTNTCMRARTYTHTRAHTHTHTRTHACTHARTH